MVSGVGVQYPLLISASIGGNLISKSTCSISTGAKNCSLGLSLLKTAPAGAYYVDVEIKDSTPMPNTRIYRKSVKVTNPNTVVDSFGKTFPISETINLTKALAASSAEVLSKKFFVTNSGNGNGGFILAAWSEATALTPLSELTWASNAQSQINVYVTNINNGNIEKLLVKGFRNIVCNIADGSLNTGVFCPSYTGARAKLEVLDSDNDTLPAGRYKGNFELIL